MPSAAHALPTASADTRAANGGLVAYATFPLGSPAILRWFDRTGRPSATVGTPQLYRGFDLAADGQRVVFSRNGSTYVTEDKRLAAVPFNDGVAGTPAVLFRVSNLLDIDRFVMPTANVFVPTGNGQRFLVAERTPDPNLPPITIVVNWSASRQH